MVKKLFLFFFACFAQAQQKPVSHTQPAAQPAPAQAKPAVQAALQWCRLGVDPVDAVRQPNWATECVIKAQAAPVIMLTGSGRQVRCLIPPLTPVVVDRKNGKALWVLQCGNPIIEPANWVPSGTRICGPEPTQPATPAAAPPAVQEPASSVPAAPSQVRVEGEVHVVHEGQVRLVHETLSPAPAPEPTTSPQPKKGWWARNAKWFVPVAIGAGTGVAIAVGRGGQKTVTYQPLPPPLYRP